MVVIVHADWCASCQHTKPAVAWMREEYGDRVDFLSLDVTDDTSTADAAARASAAGLGPFFKESGGQTGITVLGRDRKVVRHFAVENRSGPYRIALEEALQRR